MGSAITRVAFLGAVALGCLWGSKGASAGELDITLTGFSNCRGTQCMPLLREYETFMSEYLFGLSPKKLAPADTLGYAGFYMGIEGSLAIRPLGTEAEQRWLRATASRKIQRVMFNPGVHFRKGLPYSLEFGSTVTYLVLSEIVSLGGEVKWSLFEGFRTGWRGYLPDVAVRGSIVRLIGQTDLDVTLLALDGLISREFCLGGVISLTPYLGYQHVWSVVHAEPLMLKDSDDNFYPQVGETEFAVNTLGNPLLKRHHLFLGLRTRYDIFVLTLELDWGLPKSWSVANADKTARVGHQIQLSSGLGLEF